MKFRLDSIALMADIESMFHQVQVTPCDRYVLRLLWWLGGDLGQDFEEYRMTVYLFGGVWSPSCASYALWRTAEDNRAEFCENVVSCIRDFYVDDFLKFVSSQQVAIHLAGELTELLTRGGFHLTKWISNDREKMIRSVRKVLASIVKKQVLNDEVLLTVMCDAEATVNSRPMTLVFDDHKDMNTLTPNHLLLLRDTSSVPIEEFTMRDTYCRR